MCGYSSGGEDIEAFAPSERDRLAFTLAGSLTVDHLMACGFS